MTPRSLPCSLLLAAALAALSSDAAAAVAPHYTEAEAHVVFQAANDACLREDWATCLEGYERLLNAGYSSADLEYNLGTAHLKQGRTGPAILHLERALRLDPSDADAHANLERARKQQVDQLVGAPDGLDEPLAARIARHTRGDRWALAFLLFWIAGTGLLLARRRVRDDARRFALLFGSLFALAAALPSAAVTAAHVWGNEHDRDAVVVAASVPVREGPDEGIKAIFEVHEGLKVRLLDQAGTFQRIRLANGLQGYVPAESVAPIDPD